MASIAYMVLQRLIIAAEGEQAVLKQAIGRDWKGKILPLAYAVGIALSMRWSWLAQALYVLVALMWLIPDRRIERALADYAG